MARSVRSAAWLLPLVSILVGACSPGPTAHRSAAPGGTPIATAPATTQADATVQPGGLIARTIATDKGFGGLRWSPDGQAFSVSVASGTQFEGRVDVWAADGSHRIATLPGGWDSAWLSPTELLVFNTTPDGSPGSITLHSLAGAPDVVVASASGGILGSGGPRFAVVDPYVNEPPTPPRFRVFERTSAATASEASAWRISDPIEGQPIAWSADGTELAAIVDATTGTAGEARLASTRLGGSPSVVVPAAGGRIDVHLVVLRYPGGTRVPVPDAVFDARAEWSFSPDGRFVVGGSTTDAATPIVDLSANQLIWVQRAGHAGWTPAGELVLLPPDRGPLLWHPDGSVTETGLPNGVAWYGPLDGEVALVGPIEDGVAGTTTIRMGRSTSTVPLLLYAPWGTVAWAPDGSACYLLTPTDDAQQAHASLIRVSRP